MLEATTISSASPTAATSSASTTRLTKPLRFPASECPRTIHNADAPATPPRLGAPREGVYDASPGRFRSSWGRLRGGEYRARASNDPGTNDGGAGGAQNRLVTSPFEGKAE